MAEKNGKPNEARKMIEHAVAQALQAQLPLLQEQIVHRVLEILPLSLGDTITTPGDGAYREDSGGLVQAVSRIHEGSSQKEILRALLDAGSGYCSRIALFVVKAGAATGWQSRGFGEEEAVKDFPLDLIAGPVAHSYHNRTAAPANIAEMGKAFVEQFGAPANEQILMLPLALKDKVAALVYADGGDSGKLNSAALELLVIATSAWLEVISLRKHAAPREEGEPVERAVAPVHTVSSYADPFAAHVPKHIPAVSLPSDRLPPDHVPSGHVPEPVSADPVSSDHAPEPEPAEVVEVVSARAASAAAPAAAADPLAALSPEDAEIHRKAQRFARLLVDEIKLYNQAKVAEGRRNKDLYDRLKEDIDKSRGTFQKRYGSTVAVSGDYFQHELMRSLAEDDVSIMGANFRR